MYVQFAQLDPNPSWTDTAPQPIVPGESTNFIVAGMLPNTTYLMRDVLNDGTTSAPMTIHDREPADERDFPTFTDRNRLPPGTDMSQDMILHVGIDAPAGTVDHRGNRPERQRRLVL